MNGSVSGRIELGSRLGPYLLIEELGAGGAGTVFVGEDVETHKKYAVKILRPGAESIEEIHSRFIREITVAQRLNNPHIVSYHDCDVEDGVLYYAMEYVPWGSLADVIRGRGSLPWRDACECGVQMAMALQHLHASGVVHRDLKPGNVFLSDDGRLKVGDFGLARDSESPTLTVAGMTVGTCKYLAPEQALGKGDVDHKADLYALGCNLFEMIIGRTPFEIPDSYAPVSIVEMMRRHIELAPPKLSDLAPNVPSRLSDLVASLLAKDPGKRPESAATVVETLTEILAESNSDAVTQSDGESLADAPHLTSRLRASAIRPVEISTAKLVGIVVVIIVLLSLAVMFSSSK